MKKILSMLLAVTMMISMLAACNDETPVDNPDEPDNQEVQGDEPVDDGKITLVADGMTDYVIVRGENAYISEVTASTELQKYLKQISGVEIPIVTDSTAPVEKEIVVGKTNREADGEFDREELGDDGLVIKTNGQKLFLVGGEQRGTLYAVYEFLEAYLGCGFYTADVEKVPELKTITLEPIAEDKQIPIMELRSAGWFDYYDQYISVRRKVNTWCGYAYIDEQYGGSFIMNPWCHSFQNLINFNEYSSSHPEYFAHYDDGTIIDNDPAQLCLTNETVLQMSIEKVRSWITSTPNIKVVSISQNDGGGPCMCSACQKVYEEENGSYSGAVIRFVNAIATALKDEFPDVKFETLAYQYTRNVCVTKPADNVIVRLCSIEACKNHPFAECEVTTHKPSDSPVSENSFYDDIVSWSNHADKLYIWDYVTNFSEYSINFSTFRTLKENMKLFADNKVIGVFEQGSDCSRHSGEFSELRAYLTSQLLWDPYMSDDEYYGLIEDFMMYVYGPGWTYLKEFIDYRFETEQSFHASCYEDHKDIDSRIYKNKIIRVRENDVVPEGLTLEMIQNYETTDWTPFELYYTEVAMPEIVTKGYELFGKAMELAETDSQKEKIDIAMIQVQRLESHYMYFLSKQKSSNLNVSATNTLKSLGLPTDEINSMKVKLIRFFNEKVNAEYAEFNKDLYEKMMSYNISFTRERGTCFLYTEPDLKNPPREW